MQASQLPDALVELLELVQRDMPAGKTPNNPTELHMLMDLKEEGLVIISVGPNCEEFFKLTEAGAALLNARDEAQKVGQERQASILTHARFQQRENPLPDAEAVTPDFKAVQVSVARVSDLDHLDLPEPAYGEEVVDTLNEDEISWFNAYWQVNEKFKEMQRVMGGQYLKDMGSAVMEGREESFMQQAAQRITEEQAQAFFQQQRRLEYLRNVFFYNLCERIGYYDWYLSVRSHARVVKMQRKW